MPLLLDFLASNPDGGTPVPPALLTAWSVALQNTKDQSQRDGKYLIPLIDEEPAEHIAQLFSSPAITPADLHSMLEHVHDTAGSIHSPAVQEMVRQLVDVLPSDQPLPSYLKTMDWSHDKEWLISKISKHFDPTRFNDLMMVGGLLQSCLSQNCFTAGVEDWAIADLVPVLSSYAAFHAAEGGTFRGLPKGHVSHPIETAVRVSATNLAPSMSAWIDLHDDYPSLIVHAAHLEVDNQIAHHKMDASSKSSTQSWPPALVGVDALSESYNKSLSFLSPFLTSNDVQHLISKFKKHDIPLPAVLRSADDKSTITSHLSERQRPSIRSSKM